MTKFEKAKGRTNWIIVKAPYRTYIKEIPDNA